MSKKFGPTANTSTVMCTFVLQNLNKLNTQLRKKKTKEPFKRKAFVEISLWNK